MKSCTHFAFEEEARKYSALFDPPAMVERIDTAVATWAVEMPDIPKGQVYPNPEDGDPAYPAFVDENRTIELCETVIIGGAISNKMIQAALSLKSSIVRRQAAESRTLELADRSVTPAT